MGAYSLVMETYVPFSHFVSCIVCNNRNSIGSLNVVLVLSGAEVVVADSPVGRLGLTVCYDLRFPELYQRLRFTENCEVRFETLNLSRCFRCAVSIRSHGTCKSVASMVLWALTCDVVRFCWCHRLLQRPQERLTGSFFFELVLLRRNVMYDQSIHSSLFHSALFL